MLLHYNGDNAMAVIKRQYLEKFDKADLLMASLKVISDLEGFLIIKCSLLCYAHLMETLLLMNDSFTTLDTSGTLRSLASRFDETKKRFTEITFNTVK